MNTIHLIGRIVKDVEVRYSNGAQPLAYGNYTLAVDRPTKKDAERVTDFIYCKVLGKSAEFAGKYFTKGMKVAISGRMQVDNYEDANGNKRSSTYVFVNEQEFCESKKVSGGGNDFTPTNESAPREFTNPTYQGQQSSMNDGFMPVDEDFDDGDLPF